VAESVTWKIHQRLIYVKFEGHVSINDIAQATAKVTPSIREGQAPVHVIADMLQVDRYPREFSKLAGAIPHLAEPNLGKTVLVGTNNQLVKLMVDVIRHAVQIDLRMVESLEKALDLLYEADPTLPADKSS
jgi:hypothetical protein